MTRIFGGKWKLNFSYCAYQESLKIEDVEMVSVPELQSLQGYKSVKLQRWNAEDKGRKINYKTRYSTGKAGAGGSQGVWDQKDPILEK